jgi:hypothetical protein
VPLPKIEVPPRTTAVMASSLDAGAYVGARGRDARDEDRRQLSAQKEAE